MKSPFALVLALALAVAVPALAAPAEPPLWLRYPAISPDGATVVFEYKGDLWSVPAGGGTASPLTISESYEYAPVWSRDGSSLAFASDRYGNFDVFVLPSTGGEARRLTFHSTGEMPSSFTADDKAVLFSAARQDPASNAQFPTGAMSELYSVPVAGGRITRVLPIPANNVDVRGEQLLYHDYKGVESPWRKHHTSSVTRDIWVYDTKSGAYRQLTTHPAEDRNPVFGAGADDYYWLSERDGSFNVYQGSLADPSRATALTKFTKHPVRFLTRAQDGTLCFSFDGELYTLKPGAQPVKLAVRVGVDGRAILDRVVMVNEDLSDLVLAPSGKEFAYVFRGEIFVSSVEGGVTKRITDTPWQERSPGWSPDGRTLVYAAEPDQSWNITTTSIARDAEPYFHAATVLKTESVVATDAEEFQPAFSPDGKEIAYLENRVALKVVNLASKESRLVLPADHNYSYADGDQWYQWSPDGKWFLVQYGLPQRVMTPEIGLVAADGKSAVTNLTYSGYDDILPKWSLDGKAMVWGTNRDGSLSQGGSAFTWDVHALFFERAAYERFRLSKEDFALVKEAEEKKDEAKGDEGKDAKSKKDKKDKDKDKDKPADVVIDREGLAERRVRLTTHNSPATDWVLAEDGEKLFYLTAFEDGHDVWVVETRTGEASQLAKVGARVENLQLSADGKFLVLLAGGKAKKIDAEKGSVEPLKTGGEMVLKQGDERAYIFDHAWRQLKRKFYVQDLHGVDWDGYHAAYRRFLPHINNNYDFAEMLSELLGEMNASHTGCYYRPTSPTGDQTASLGLFYDDAFTGAGLKVAEVVAGGPCDKSSLRLRAGHVIEKIDGQPVAADADWARHLNRRIGQRVLLSVLDPAKGERWDEEVKPINPGEENELLYKRWVRNRRDEVSRLSGGKVGYVHVRSMNDASMRHVFEEALGRNIGCEALVVDTRFNGGGNIHEQLSDFLAGKAYFDIIPHGQFVGSESYDKWTKPSIVVMGESNYSDAHLFPVAYKTKGVGRTLGMPVPGTGTFVWWEPQIDPSLRFGIPMGGWRGQDGKFCENTQLEPDVLVRNEPDVLTKGRDQQLEAAVRELLKQQ
ncbi:MAG: PD40 domain-containing protein [bacterium]|nr:PD40 domain-containing protein [bacterium]